MLLINNNDVHRILSVEECVSVQKEAFRGLLTGASVYRPRVDVYAPCDRQDAYFRWGSVDGACQGYFAIRIKSDILTWPTNQSGLQTEKNHCVQPGTYCGLVLLFSTGNGEPLAIINDGNLQHLRVGASAGLGTELLSRENSRSVGLVGSGAMARTFLPAIAAVRSLERVKVFSRSKANREQYAREMADQLGIEVIAVDDPAAAVRGVDIVATCTDSMIPVLEKQWIEPGMHVVALGTREISIDVASRFDIKVRQGNEEMPMEEHGQFRKAISGSFNAYVSGSEEELARIPKNKQPRLSMRDWPVYTDVLAGTTPGRTSAEQVTFYHTIGNWGLQFAAVGGLVYRKAREAGVGIELPTSWLLQSVRN